MNLHAIPDRGTVENLVHVQELQHQDEIVKISLTAKTKGPARKDVNSSTWMGLSVDAEPLASRVSLKLRNIGSGVVKIGKGASASDVKSYWKIDPGQTVEFDFSGDATVVKLWGQAQSIMSTLLIEEA